MSDFVYFQTAIIILYFHTSASYNTKDAPFLERLREYKFYIILQPFLLLKLLLKLVRSCLSHQLNRNLQRRRLEHLRLC